MLYDKAKYDIWMKKVAADILRRTGMTAADLPDWSYLDAFIDGVPFKAAATMVIKYAKDE